MSKLRVRQPDGSVVDIPIGGGGSGGSGEDGKTPYIQDGYWYIDGVNLGVKAEGKDGTDGVSPTVTASKSGTVTTITITDKNGTKTAKINDGTNGKDGTNGTNGTNGKDGADGVSPTITTSKSGKVTTITITDKNGTKTATVNDGADGKDGTNGTNGKDGKTPVKGTDYFTASDKAEMVNSVKNDFEENGLAVGADGGDATVIRKNHVALISSTGEGAYMTSEGKGSISFYDSDTDDNVILSNIAEPDGYYDAANKGYVDSKTTDKAETWTFTLADGSTVTKKVVLA